MKTLDIFRLADLCIDAGCFPALMEKRYFLFLQMAGSGCARIHRQEVSFTLDSPCRVWLMSGRDRVLLGDAHALPADLSSGTRQQLKGYE